MILNQTRHFRHKKTYPTLLYRAVFQHLTSFNLLFETLRNNAFKHQQTAFHK